MHRRSYMFRLNTHMQSINKSMAVLIKRVFGETALKRYIQSYRKPRSIILPNKIRIRIRLYMRLQNSKFDNVITSNIINLLLMIAIIE